MANHRDSYFNLIEFDWYQMKSNLSKNNQKYRCLIKKIASELLIYSYQILLNLTKIRRY